MAKRAEQPFFIVGAQRSGTTMLRLMLNSHSRLSVPFESDFLRVYPRLSEYGDLTAPANADRLLADIERDTWTKKGQIVKDRDAVLAHPIVDFASLIDAVFEEHAKAQGKERWGVKTPGYVTEIDVLWRLFPDCRIVHLVRDGRDVAVSLGGLSWGTTNVPRVAADWRWKVTLGRKMGNLLPGQYIEVQYERLVLEPRRTLERICEFLEERFEPSLLDYHERAEDEMPADSMQWHRSSVSAPDPDKVSGWRHRMSEADRILFESVAGDALDLFGYPREGLRPTVRSRARSLYYALIRRW